MTLPRVTVTGSYQTGTGPEAGSVTFTPLSRGVDSAGGVMLTRSPVIVPLVDGEFSVELVPSDAAGMVPNPVRYAVEELFAGSSRRYIVVIPTSAETVKLSSLAPVDDPFPVEDLVMDGGGAAA